MEMSDFEKFSHLRHSLFVHAEILERTRKEIKNQIEQISSLINQLDIVTGRDNNEMR